MASHPRPNRKNLRHFWLDGRQVPYAFFYHHHLICFLLKHQRNLFFVFFFLFGSYFLHLSYLDHVLSFFIPRPTTNVPTPRRPDPGRRRLGGVHKLRRRRWPSCPHRPVPRRHQNRRQAQPSPDRARRQCRHMPRGIAN